MPLGGLSDWYSKVHFNAVLCTRRCCSISLANPYTFTNFCARFSTVLETDLAVLSWLKAHLRDYFGFSSAEIHGTLVLLLLCCFCLIIPQGLKWYHSRQPLVSNDQDVALLERTLALLEAQKQGPKPINSKRKKARPPAQSLSTFDINTASATQLSTIRGIGPVLSARIVRFRNKLGGFVNQDQYQEVYGLLPELIVRLKQCTYISEGFQPEKLKVNVADIQTLATHPYITYRQAQSIVHYRAQHGPLLTAEALNTWVPIDEATWKKLAPYVAFSL